MNVHGLSCYHLYLSHLHYTTPKVKCQPLFAKILTNPAECGIMYLPVFPRALLRKGVHVMELFSFVVSVLAGVVANLVSKWLDGDE